MRILKFLFKLFLVLVGLFLLSGLVFPEISYTTSQQVNLPVEKTFDLFNDGDKMKEWMTSLKEFTTVEKKPGVVGSKYRLVVDTQGSIVEMKELVTAFKKNEKVSLSIQSIEMIKKDNYTFRSVGNQTIIKNESTTAGKTYFLKCLYASFYLLIKREDQAILDSFKTYAEKQ